MGLKAEAIAFLRLNGEQWRRELERSKGDVKKFAKEAADVLKTAAAAAIGLASAAVLIGTQFQAQMVKVQGAAGATAGELRSLETTARRVGVSMATGAKAAAEGQYALLDAGLGVKGTMQALPGVIALAGAASTELGSAANLTATALRVWKKDASETNSVVNALFAVTQQSKLGVEGLTTALGAAGPVASLYGLGFEETLATLAKMTDVTQDAGKASELFRATLAGVTAAAARGTSVFGGALAGWSAQTEGLSGAVARLQGAGISSAEVLAELGESAGVGLAALMRSGAQSVRDLQAAITGTDAAFTAHRAHLASTAGRMQGLVAAVQELGLRVFDVIEGPLNEAISGLTGLLTENFDTISGAVGTVVDALVEVGGALKTVATFVADNAVVYGVAAAGLVAYYQGVRIVAAATAVWNAIQAASPIGLVILAVAALATGIALLAEKMGGWGVIQAKVVGFGRELWVRLREAAELTWEAIKLGGNVFAALGNTITTALGMAWDVLKAFGTFVVQNFLLIGEAILKPWKAGEIAEQIAQTMQTTIDDIVAIAESGKIGAIWEGLTEGFKTAKAEIVADASAMVAQIRAETQAAVEAAREAREAGKGGGGGGGGGELQAVTDSETQRAEKILEVRGNLHTLLREMTALSGAELEADRVADVEREQGRAEAIAEVNQRLFDRVRGAASTAYATMAREAAKAYKIQEIAKVKLGAMLIQSTRDAAAAEIDAQGQVAAQRAAFEFAMAVGAAARLDFRAAGLHALSGLKFAALAGSAAIGASLLRGGSGPAETGGGGSGSDAELAGSSTTGTTARSGSVSIGERSGPETVNVFVQTYVYGHVLGDLDQVVDEKVVPRLRELIAGKAF